MFIHQPAALNRYYGEHSIQPHPTKPGQTTIRKVTMYEDKDKIEAEASFLEKRKSLPCEQLVEIVATQMSSSNGVMCSKNVCGGVSFEFTSRTLLTEIKQRKEFDRPFSAEELCVILRDTVRRYLT